MSLDNAFAGAAVAVVVMPVQPTTIRYVVSPHVGEEGIVVVAETLGLIQVVVAPVSTAVVAAIVVAVVAKTLLPAPDGVVTVVVIVFYYYSNRYPIHCFCCCSTSGCPCLLTTTGSQIDWSGGPAMPTAWIESPGGAAGWLPH